MSELAIVSARRTRLKAMARGGSRGAKAALELAADPGRFLSTVQIGISLIGILAGAYSGASLGGPVGERLVRFGLDPDTALTVGFWLVIILTTYETEWRNFSENLSGLVGGDHPTLLNIEGLGEDKGRASSFLRMDIS